MKPSRVVIKELFGVGEASQVFAALCERRGSFFLDSGLDSGGVGRFSFIGFDPFLEFRARGSEITLASNSGERTVFDGDPLTELRKLAEKYRAEPNGVATDIPFLGGMVGGLSYEFGAGLERVTSPLPGDLPMPDVQFGFYDGVLVFDEKTGRVFAIANPVEQDGVDEILARLEGVIGLSPVAAAEMSSSKPSQRGDEAMRRGVEPVSSFEKAEYLNTVARIKNYIQAGDVYQVNLAQRFETTLHDHPYALYRRLRQRSPAPFASYLNLGEFQVVSSSPERFLRLRDGTLETRPIKGTRPRGKNAEEDAQLRAELLTSEKDRAELLMIVDLERNDLGRVCEFGTVKVDELFRIETHPTVFHLVSTVSGQVRRGCDVWDCIRATFPGGSITGAPKIRSMQVIAEIEPRRRDWYTGAIGYIGFDGSCDLNIAIRTILCRGNRAYYHVGGGIVWDSDPESEYQETLDKGRAMRAALME